jgi:hypothetical protein
MSLPVTGEEHDEVDHLIRPGEAAILGKATSTARH